MRNVLWKIWTRTNTEKKALEVLSRVLKRMDKSAEIISVEPYPKINGYVIRFSIELESESWNDQIIESFRIGQFVASAWTLTGDVANDPGGWSSSASDSGVEAIQWSFR